MSEELHLIHKPSEPRRPLDDRPLPKRSKVRTTDPRDTLEILVESEGLAADEPTTVGKVFKSTVSRIPDHTALRYKEDGVWNDITYKEYYDLVIKAAKGFLKVRICTLYIHTHTHKILVQSYVIVSRAICQTFSGYNIVWPPIPPSSEN